MSDPLYQRWSYVEADPAMMLFTAALQAWQLPILPGQSVLELGCNETHFLDKLHETDPTLQLTGVDWNASDHRARGYGIDGWTFKQGSAFDASLFEPESFDWVLLLGALEHFGLGYYGDPRADIGDLLTLAAISKWLKPGGSVYFDVPCNPQDEQTPHFRTYAPKTVTERLMGAPGHDLVEVARGYSLPEPRAGQWIPQPTVRLQPYHFIAVWARKER